MTHYLHMFPEADQDPQTIEYWLEDMLQDPVVSDVIQTEAFRRLEGISFLGAIDYAYPSLNLVKKERSRAQHSLHVAALANYVATTRCHDLSLKRHIVLAGLLHDVGHLPLSHSAEPYFKESLGVGHHQLGEQILNGHNALGKDLHAVLERHTDVSFLSDLVNGTVSDSDSGDLFSSPINLDTIDGIVRTCTAMAAEPVSINRLAVARAAFIESDNSRYKTMDDFWYLKHFVYEHMINSSTSLVADFNVRNYFAEAYTKLAENDLLGTEKSWKLLHHDLFQGFKGGLNNDCKRIDFVKRSYSINSCLSGSQRYITEKWQSCLELGGNQQQSEPEQRSFYFLKLNTAG